ncbi:MAG: hypothetical protein ACYSUI_14155 [Planctomycetota bacterium]
MSEEGSDEVPQLVEAVAAEVYRVSLGEGIIQEQLVLGVDGGLQLHGGRPAVFVYDAEISSYTERRVDTRIVHAAGAVIEEDGKLVGNLMAGLGADISVGLETVEFLTVRNDALASAESNHEDPAGPGDDVRMWFRFDCPTNRIELLPSQSEDATDSLLSGFSEHVFGQFAADFESG